MISIELRIVNKLGLHARAAARLAGLARQFEAEIQIEYLGHRVNAKSIMSLLMLAAGQGTPLMLWVQGPDEGAAAEALQRLFTERFGEAE